LNAAIGDLCEMTDLLGETVNEAEALRKEVGWIGVGAVCEAVRRGKEV